MSLDSLSQTWSPVHATLCGKHRLCRPCDRKRANLGYIAGNPEEYRILRSRVGRNSEQSRDTGANSKLQPNNSLVAGSNPAGPTNHFNEFCGFFLISVIGELRLGCGLLRTCQRVQPVDEVNISPWNQVDVLIRRDLD